MFPSKASVVLVFFASLCLMSCTVASPLRRLLSYRAQRSNFLHLYITAEKVSNLTRELHQKYKEDSFNDTEKIVRLQDLMAPYNGTDLPNIQNVQRVQTTSQSDHEVVCLHYVNLVTFKHVLEKVNQTEETGRFATSIDEIVKELANIIERLETAQELQSPCYGTQPPSSDTINLNATTTELNQQTLYLYILQEFNDYISRVECDYEILSDRHQG